MIKINRILLLCFFLFYSVVFSREKENPFSTSENITYTYSQKNQNQFNTTDHETFNDAQNLTYGTGPPGGGDDDTVPIDKYIPFLIIVAVTMIGYIGKKKRTLEN